MIRTANFQRDLHRSDVVSNSRSWDDPNYRPRQRFFTRQNPPSLVKQTILLAGAFLLVLMMSILSITKFWPDTLQYKSDECRPQPQVHGQLNQELESAQIPQDFNLNSLHITESDMKASSENQKI